MDVTRKHVTDDNGVVDAWKVGRMVDELQRNPQGCVRVPLVNDKHKELKTLYINLHYTRAVAYDYPFFGFDVFSVVKSEQATLFKYIAKRFKDWSTKGKKFSLMLMDCQNELTFDVSFMIYKYITFEPPRIKFDPYLLGNNFGISDSFLCGCIRCVNHTDNPVWDLYKVTDKDLQDHLKSDIHNR